MGLYLNPGNRAFTISSNDDIYVDKSDLISFTNSRIDKQHRYICVSRPRRFGKSMAAEMLLAYYDKNCISEDLFKKLHISNDKSYNMHLNKYDVIYLDMQQILEDSGNLDNFIPYLQNEVISELDEEYPGIIKPGEKSLPKALAVTFSKTSNINKGFIIIIDEWDCIFREAKNKFDIHKKYLDFLKNLFKGRTYVKLAYMTGILPIKKYGSHSALNVFDEFSMTNPSILSAYTGFTEDEVMDLCRKHNMDFNEMQYWYNGYLFDDEMHIYNPESVVNAILRKKFISYWTRTETYEALKIYIDMNFDGLKDNIIKMLCGNKIKISTDTFQNDMTTFASKDDVLTLLVHLGYLAYDYNSKEVFIPNHEIEEEFTIATKSSNWNEIIKSITLSERLLEATLSLKSEKVAEIIDEIHMATVSILQYNNENSLACVISLAYYSAKKDYIINREFPTGNGFADLVFIPRKNIEKPAIIVELKWNVTAEGAIKQIKEKKYISSLKEYSGKLIIAGINYNKKNKKHECILEVIYK